MSWSKFPSIVLMFMLMEDSGTCIQAKGYLCPYLKERSQLVEGVGAGVMKSTRKPSAKEAL